MAISCAPEIGFDFQNEGADWMANLNLNTSATMMNRVGLDMDAPAIKLRAQWKLVIVNNHIKGILGPMRWGDMVKLTGDGFH